MTLPDTLRPFLSRIIAVLVAAGVSWLTVHGVLNLDEATRHDFVDSIVGLLAEFTTIYFATHRLADKKFNPSDAASKHLAVEGKIDVARIKTAEHEAAQ
jgi:hypothetical protein